MVGLKGTTSHALIDQVVLHSNIEGIAVVVPQYKEAIPVLTKGEAALVGPPDRIAALHQAPAGRYGVHSVRWRENVQV